MPKLKIEMTVDLPQGAIDEFLKNFEQYKKVDGARKTIVSLALLADIKRTSGTPLVLPAMIASAFDIAVEKGTCTLTPLDDTQPAALTSPDTFAA